MGKRIDLHNILVECMEECGLHPNVYYQPPESVKMKYPCIVYTRQDIEYLYSDNRVYKGFPIYQITLISKDPDNPLVDYLPTKLLVSYDRHYVSDNLNHDIFRLAY